MGCRAVPLSSYRLGIPLARVLWERLPDLGGESGLQRSFRLGLAQTGGRKYPEWAHPRGGRVRPTQTGTREGGSEQEENLRTWWEKPELGELPEPWDIQ